MPGAEYADEGRAAPGGGGGAAVPPQPQRELIPVRMVVQYAYCRRLGYLEYEHGEFEHNEFTIDGRYKHRRVDKPAGQRKMAGAVAAAQAQDGGDDAKGGGAGTAAAPKGRKGGEVIHSRSLELSDEAVGLVGRLDVLEADGRRATPVEYKRGKVPKTPEGTYLDHRVHVCAQALLLRANGFECDTGVVYYVESRRRVEVPIDAGLEAETLRLIDGLRADAASGLIPPPLVDSPKCPGCSLVGICMPDEVNLLSGDEDRAVTRDQVRRMYPVRPDAVPLYVKEQWATIGKSGDRLVVKRRGGDPVEYKLLDVSEVSVYGNVQITTQALRELCARNIPVSFASYGGWFYGMLTGTVSKNIYVRIAQHEAYADQKRSMGIARQIVYGKARNCATMLRRNGPDGDEPVAAAVLDLESLAERALSEKKYDALLGIEGMAARVYFGRFASMVKAGGAAAGFSFEGRSRRPPRDPLNAVLSYLYMLLEKDARLAAMRVGLDPYLGFLHRPRHGKAALALDMMEEFRPLIADSVCLRAVNTGRVSESDFVRTGIGTSMTDAARRTLLDAYSRRLDEQVMHPLLGYSASYRRVLETQARLLSRHLLGEVPSYPAFRTR